MSCTSDAPAVAPAVTDWRQEALRAIENSESKQVNDLWLTLFWAALVSPRRSMVCEPYPPFLRNAEGEKDFIGAEYAVSQIPSLSRLQSQIASIPPISLRLIPWFQSERKVQLRSVPIADFPLKGSFVGTDQPDFVYEIVHTNAAENAAWDQLRREFNSSMAYHGSPLHNWYSIISNGLSTTFSSDESLFGDGIYLSSDAAVAMHFRKPGRTWTQSGHGESLSCLLVAEVIHHPASVKRSEADGPSARPMPGVTLDHRLPRSYILVKNNLHVRARYIIIWKQTAPSRTAKWWLLIVLYGFIMFR